MGTSTHKSGQKGGTPLVPSWLEEEDSSSNETLPPQGDSKRFSAPRGNFTRYVGSGGSNRGALRRSTSNYVKQSLGGSRNATVRLGAARQSTAKLFEFINSMARGGTPIAGREFELRNLIGKHADDVFCDIAEFVCPDGGTTDEGIARSSYFEAIVDMPELSQVNIENMTIDQMASFLQLYMSNIIMERLLNDIGNKTISLPDDIQKVSYIQNQIKDFIHGNISDAFSELNVKSQLGNINNQQTKEIVDSVYERAYSIMETLGEDE